MKSPFLPALAALILTSTLQPSDAGAASTMANQKVVANAGSAKQELPILKPIRQAKIHMAIFKTTISKSTTGTGYMWNQETVCDVNFDAPVYDLRGLSDYMYAYGSGKECTTTIGGKKRIIGTTAGITLNTESLFGPGTPAIDRKTLGAHVFIRPDDPSEIVKAEDSVHQTAWTRDLNLKNIGLVLQQDIDQVCNSNGVCNPKPQEFMSATAEFED